MQADALQDLLAELLTPAPTHRRQMTAADAEEAIAAWLGLSVPAVRQVLLGAWGQQRGALSASDVAEALEAGDWTGPVLDAWRESYAEVIQLLTPRWEEGARRASATIARGLGVGIEAEVFAGRMAAWIDSHGGELVAYLTDTQHDAMRAVLTAAIPVEGVAPATLAARLRPFVGLTPREGRTLTALRAALEEEGELTPAQVDAAVSRRADQLLDTRSTRIARTEMAEAYNEGAIQTVRVASSSEGGVPYVKVWLTGADERVCSVCGPLHETRAPLNSNFDGGRDRPTAHPGCRCTLLFEEATP